MKQIPSSNINIHSDISNNICSNNLEVKHELMEVENVGLVQNKSLNNITAKTSNLIKLPSPIKADRLDLYLNGYDFLKRKYLVDGFRFGFRLKNYSFNHSDNDKTLKSALNLPDIVDTKLKKRIFCRKNFRPFI